MSRGERVCLDQTGRNSLFEKLSVILLYSSNFTRTKITILEYLRVFENPKYYYPCELTRAGYCTSQPFGGDIGK